jgi:hypothetical protein
VGYIRLCHCGRPLPCAAHPGTPLGFLSPLARHGSLEEDESMGEAERRKPLQGMRRDGRLVVHHIVRPQDGGTDETSNLMTLCRPCHGNAHLKR